MNADREDADLTRPLAQHPTTALPSPHPAPASMASGSATAPAPAPPPPAGVTSTAASSRSGTAFGMVLGGLVMLWVAVSVVLEPHPAEMAALAGAVVLLGAVLAGLGWVSGRTRRRP